MIWNFFKFNQISLKLIFFALKFVENWLLTFFFLNNAKNVKYWIPHITYKMKKFPVIWYFSMKQSLDINLLKK